MSEGVLLKPFEEQHWSKVLEWVNDPELRTCIGTIWPVTIQQHRKWYETLQLDRSRVTFAIVHAGEHVGMIGLTGIDLIYRNAEIWLYLGDAGARRGGAGRVAVNQILDYAFGTLGLHRVRAEVFGFNERACRFFLSCGFKQEGTLREAVFKRGRFWDRHVFGILDRESLSSESAEFRVI